MTTDAHRGHPATAPGGPSSAAGRDPLPLAGRTVLVTGVSRRVGIGHAIACRAAGYGASIVAHHYRPHDASQPRGADDVDAAKAAIAGLTPTISEELIDAGITVNTVNPGPVDTGYVTEADREATAAMFPQGRWGEPDDAARLITWLLTDEARWITGQVINSEGGFARWRH